MSEGIEFILNDPGTLVADLPNATLLPFPTDKQDANFELGVSMAIHGWYTLTTAVDNLWGGPQSAEKRDWISGVVVDEFKNNKEIDIIYIHELLCGAMEDEFDTVIEDESTIQVAQKIVNCYKQCKENYFDQIKDMYAKWLARQQNKQKIIANIVNDPLNPNVSDSEEEDVEFDQDYEMMDIVDDQQVKRKEEPIIDDDGFTVVTGKSGRR